MVDKPLEATTEMLPVLTPLGRFAVFSRTVKLAGVVPEEGSMVIHDVVVLAVTEALEPSLILALS